MGSLVVGGSSNAGSGGNNAVFGDHYDSVSDEVARSIGLGHPLLVGDDHPLADAGILVDDGLANNGALTDTHVRDSGGGVALPVRCRLVQISPHEDGVRELHA